MLHLFSKSTEVPTENVKQPRACHWALQYMSFWVYIPWEVGQGAGRGLRGMARDKNSSQDPELAKHQTGKETSGLRRQVVLIYGFRSTICSCMTCHADASNEGTDCSSGLSSDCFFPLWVWLIIQFVFNERKNKAYIKEKIHLHVVLILYHIPFV